MKPSLTRWAFSLARVHGAPHIAKKHRYEIGYILCSLLVNQAQRHAMMPDEEWYMKILAIAMAATLTACAPLTHEEWERQNRMIQAMQATQAQQRANAPAPYMLPTNQSRPYSPPEYQQPQYQPPQQQQGVRALWTGSSRIVQTITNQSGWECQYQYNGQYFNRTFTSACPSSIQSTQVKAFQQFF